MKKEPRKYSRRAVFGQLAGRFLVTLDEARGHRHFTFDELEKFEKEKFEPMIPSLLPDWGIVPKKDGLFGINRQSGEEILILEPTGENLAAFNLINGGRSIAEIVRAFGTKSGWDTARSYEFIKKMIIHLMRRRVCTLAFPSSPGSR
jgi:hypothetical protein